MQMNTVAWTLWLISQVGAPQTVTPLAMYPSAKECYESMNQINTFMQKTFTSEPNFGVLMCVAGAPVKH
jgi:hypothetical protein